MNQTELATLAGLTQPTISALERGGSTTSGKLASIADALKVSALWLETGMGERDVPTVAEAGDAQVHMVPLLDCRGSCGNGREYYGDPENAPIAVPDRVLKRYHVRPENLVGLYADGDSMNSFIVHGDMLFFDTTASDLKDGRIYLLDTPDGLRVKRVHRRADGRVSLRSDNPDKTRYPDEEYSAEAASLLTIRGCFVFRMGG